MTTITQFRAALRIVRGHRALAQTNRRLARVYAGAGCDVLAQHAARVARIEASRARAAMRDARIFRAIAMLEA